MTDALLDALNPVRISLKDETGQRVGPVRANVSHGYIVVIPFAFQRVGRRVAPFWCPGPCLTLLLTIFTMCFAPPDILVCVPPAALAIMGPST